MKADRTYLGVDYGVRRVAWALLRPGHPDRTAVGELCLPGNRNTKGVCDLCQLAELVEYFHAEVVCCLGVRDVVAVEAPITGMSSDKRTAARMGMVAGALMSAASVKTNNHLLLPPATWKKAAVGHGNATKTEVLAWARTCYPQVEIASQDIADAMGIATAGMNRWIGGDSCL